MLHVHDYDPILSDVHSAISFSITELTEQQYTNDNDCNIPEQNEPRVNDRLNTFYWDQERKEHFIHNLDKNAIRNISNKLLALNSNERIGNQNNASIKNKLDEITLDISRVFQNAASQTMLRKKRDERAPSDNNKKYKDYKGPWYNEECNEKRKELNKCRKSYSLNKSPANLTTLRDVSRGYKRIIRKNYTKHCATIRNKVKDLKKGNPKEFWNFCTSKKDQNEEVRVDLNKFYDFFRNINSKQADQRIETREATDNEDTDKPITELEIRVATQKLKSNKAAGDDRIINEFIKSSIEIMMPIYHQLFNIVFSYGSIPESWTTGIVKPIYKGKGDKCNPDNYRPITILSCLGKLFTAILNNRLKVFCDKNDVVGEDQLGFREGYSTIDGIFILHSLIEILKARKQTLFCAFIDLKKCFGSIWRQGLWNKMTSLNIGYKMLSTIKAIYNNVKSCIMINGRRSDSFACLNGLREGENLSPILFSIYVNDLNSYLREKNCTGIEDSLTDLPVYLQLLALMYADDTVLFATSRKAMQDTLDAYNDYCKLWKLDINANKTKIMNFGRTPRRNQFEINGATIENVNSFKYLGVVFSKNGRYINAIKENINKARRALYTLRLSCQRKCIPIDCQIELYQKMIEPILMYGCEVWGIENIAPLEKFRLQFFKSLLKLRKNTPNYMVYGELGIMPLELTINKRMLNFWHKIVDGRDNKLTSQIYRLMWQDHTMNAIPYKWILKVENLIIESGNMWVLNQNKVELHTIKDVERTIGDQELQNLRANGSVSGKGKFYMNLKEIWEPEMYLSLLSDHQIITLAKFRCANFKLPIETGRYDTTPAHERKCIVCVDLIGDEYHYLFECPLFMEIRKKYLEKNLYEKPSMYKMLNLFKSKKACTLRKLSTFVGIIMKRLA